jgi:hypothetical protein
VLNEHQTRKLPQRLLGTALPNQSALAGVILPRRTTYTRDPSQFHGNVCAVTKVQPFGVQHPQQNPLTDERVVIVGTGDHAALAFECFTNDSPHQVVAFSAEPEFLHSGEYCGRPMIRLDRLTASYPPTKHRVFVAVSATQLNRVRRRLFATVKAAGYDCVSYVSKSSFLWNNVEIGENVYIGELNLLHHRVRIGDNVVIASGTHIGHGSVIGDDCYLEGYQKLSSASFRGSPSNC